MRGAHALVLASTAPETSSLGAMEALASGTPVIAFPSEVSPEIVEHVVTGVLVSDERDIADAIVAEDTIDPAICRDTRADVLR